MPKNTPTKSSTFLEGRTITKVVNSKNKIELHLDNGSTFAVTPRSIGWDGECCLSFEFSPFDTAKSPEDFKPIGLNLVCDWDLCLEMLQRCGVRLKEKNQLIVTKTAEKSNKSLSEIARKTAEREVADAVSSVERISRLLSAIREVMHVGPDESPETLRKKRI